MARTLLATIAILAVTLGACSDDDDISDASATATASATYDAVTRLPIAPSPSNFSQISWDVSPDGTRVAFIGGGFGLYVAEAPDFTPHRLAVGPAEEPRWSPDGQFIVFNVESEGLNVIRADGGAAVRLSPEQDEWRTRIVRVHGWIDNRTIGYEAHCGTGCQYLFELAIERSGDVPVAASLSQILFIRTVPGTIASALAFYYSPDFRFIAADYGGTPRVASYERETGEQWLLTFDDDPVGVELVRSFAGWDEDSVTFLYREAVGMAAEPVTQASNWTCWRADPRSRTRTRVDGELCGV